MIRAALRIDELRTVEDLRRLREEWSELWERVASATPFQSPAWLLPWMESFAPGEPLVLALRERGTLIGVAPFYVAPDTHGRRWLRLVGVGNSDYLDMLAPDEHAPLVGDAVFAHLYRRRAVWDVADLWPLAPDAVLSRSRAPIPLGDTLSVEDVCPVLSLPSAPERLADHVPARFLARIRYYRRRLERLGDVRVCVGTTETKGSMLDTLIDLHEARWRERGGQGVLHDPAVRGFHRAALPALLAQGSVRLAGIAVDDHVVACTYMLTRGEQAWYYLGGFDPAFERFSVGTVAVADAIEAAIARGARRFDFLRGAEAYKYAWGAADRNLFRRTLRHSGTLGETTPTRLTTRTGNPRSSEVAVRHQP